MIKRISTLLAVLLLSGTVSADEGMWLIHLLQKIYPQMRAEGLKLKPEEIYNPEAEALADAVVVIDGGIGTGSMISEQGLMITNHHVAYADICKLSTPEKNILFNGFWAKDRSEELPVEGKTVMFLRSVEDITREAVHYRDSLEKAGRWGIMGPRKLVGEMERRHRKPGLEPWCAQMWDGRVCLLLQYEVYRDVRLVGAPPARIGSFGGETDNWSWPQHKGDFALYRIYGDEQGRPAPYSPENKPICPRRHLRISTHGLKEGDFAMVIGFPGITHRYGSSMAIDEKALKNPIIEECRHDRMEIIRGRMEADSLVRLAYSEGYFNLSNYADYVRWENKCLRRYDVSDVREQEQQAIQRWIDADPARKAQYGTLIEELKRGYEARRDAMLARTWYQESWFMPSKALVATNRFSSLAARLLRDGCDTLRCASKEAQGLLKAVSHLEAGYDEQTDRALFINALKDFTREVEPALWGEHLRSEMARYEGRAEQLAAEAFDASFCRNATCYREFLACDRAMSEILADPLVALNHSVQFAPFAAAIDEAEKGVGVDVSELESRYRDLQYDYREAMGRAQYPNANSTMRLTYGSARSITPRDGVQCAYRSTIRGYIEKEDPSNYDFVVDDKLKKLIAARDWGRWGEKGELYVNFMTDNDITGGNSGSPMLDAKGRLIGLAFDGNRESMAGDAWFHPELSRTIGVDIRYVMWVIEKWAEAGYLLQELEFE